MDKKNTIIGVLLLVAAFGLFLFGPRQATPPPPTFTPAPAPTPGAAVPSNGDTPLEQAAPTNATTPAASGDVPVVLSSAAVPPAWFAPIEPSHENEAFVTLRNEFVEVRFTNYGGAIAEIALHQHEARKEGDEPLVLNAERHAPTLAFNRLAGIDFNTAYEQVSASDRQVVYRRVTGGLEVTRTYSLSADAAMQDPYVVHNETTLRNVGTAPISGGRMAVNLGTARLVHESDDGQYLQAGRFDGEDLRLTRIPELNESSGYFGIFGKHPARPLIDNPGTAVWATVENQFFAAIITPQRPGTGIAVRRVEFPLNAEGIRPQHGLTSDLFFDVNNLPAGGSETLAFDVYAGPKEFNRLERLGKDQDEVMQWGMFSFFAKLLLTLLTKVHSVFAGSAWSWGWAIISTTVIIRVLMWPLTGMSTRAAKRMAKIQGPLKELQEKYKDNRQKLTEETMKLWKEHKVNPVAGCLPILLQMPIFFGLFSMLRTASELRFAEFLWAADLSAPDTIARIPLGLFTLPINPMPILMGISSMVQMRMTPTPTTDNPSAKMMKFMPILFTVLCYNFSSGLAVYWTASNIFSIFQQWVTNRQKDPVVAVPVKAGAAERAKPVKDAKVTNVSRPKKKK